MDTKLVRGLVFSGDITKPTIIRDGAILVEGDMIRRVGKYEDVAKAYRYDSELGSDHHIVIPGLVNAHHHGRALSTLQAGVADGPLEVWLPDLFGSYRADIYCDTLLAAMNMIRLGTTTVLCHQCERDPAEVSYEEDLESSLQAFIDSGIRVGYAPAISDRNKYTYLNEEKWLSTLPKDVRDKLEPFREDDSSRLKRYFSTFGYLREKYHGAQGRVQLLYGPHGPEWCSDQLFEEIGKRAKQHNLNIHMHLSETKYQKRHADLTYGKSAIEHLKDIDLLGPHVSFAHCVWLTAQEIRLLSETGAIPVHNPSSNLRLHSGISPVVSMTRAGVPVALGTDSTGLNDDDDMIQEMRLCWLIHRLPGVTSAYLESTRVFDMATTAGAKAAGFERQVGAIEVRRKADLVLLDGRRILSPLMSSRIPLSDVILQRAKASDIDTVIIDGKVALREGRFPEFNEDSTLKRLTKSIVEPDTGRVRDIDAIKKSLREFYGKWDNERGYVYNPTYSD